MRSGEKRVAHKNINFKQLAGVEKSTKVMNRTKSKPKNSTPVKRLDEVFNEDNGGDSQQSGASGPWTITPIVSRVNKTVNGAMTKQAVNARPTKSKQLSVNAKRVSSAINSRKKQNNDSRLCTQGANMEDGEIVEVTARETGEFEDSEEAAIQLEIAEMERKLSARRLTELKRKRDILKRKLSNEEVGETSKSEGKKEKRGKRVDKGWDGSIESDSRLEDNMQLFQDNGSGGGLPAFQTVKSIFVDEPVSQKKRSKRVEVREKEESESEEESEASDFEETKSKQCGRPKEKQGKIVSGMFARASGTRLVRQVLHAQAMIDQDELEKGDDIEFNEMSFNLLVAGEMEIVLSNISPEEKYTRLEMLKRLAYKSQFLGIEACLKAYKGFLGKFERGKYRWGSQEALREFEENLRFRAFTTYRVREEGWDREKDNRRKHYQFTQGGGFRSAGRKFYCLDFNKGKCLHTESHEGFFNKMPVVKTHMCKDCWEKDRAERGHAENSSACPHKG